MNEKSVVAAAPASANDHANEASSIVDSIKQVAKTPINEKAAKFKHFTSTFGSAPAIISSFESSTMFSNKRKNDHLDDLLSDEEGTAVEEIDHEKETIMLVSKMNHVENRNRPESSATTMSDIEQVAGELRRAVAQSSSKTIVGLNDYIVCGTCQTDFKLSDIVSFIEHKVNKCAKSRNSSYRVRNNASNYYASLLGYQSEWFALNFCLNRFIKLVVCSFFCNYKTS